MNSPFISRATGFIFHTEFHRRLRHGQVDIWRDLGIDNAMQHSLVLSISLAETQGHQKTVRLRGNIFLASARLSSALRTYSSSWEYHG